LALLRAAAAAASLSPYLGGGSTPNVVHRTIRNGDDREDAYSTGVRGSAAAGCSTRPPGALADGAATRSAADSAPHPVAVPLGCSSPRKGDDHGSATSGDVATAGGDARLLSATAATKGTRADAGSGGSLGGGRLHLRCREMRPRLARWLPTIVSIRCYVQGCAWCLSSRRCTTLWGR
jgi:hypothetical protein